MCAVLAYISALVFYRAILIGEPVFGGNSDPGSYTATGTFDLRNIIPGITGNTRQFFTLIHNDFAMLWQGLIALLCGSFIFISVKYSEQRKSLAFCAVLLITAITAALSFGVFLALKNPGIYPRHMAGFGIFIAAIGISAAADGRPSRITRTITKFGVIALVWCFIVFANSYGNALADQQRYNNFRVETLVHDLSRLFSETPISLQIKNEIEHTAVIENIAKRAPVIKRLVPYRKRDFGWNILYLTKYYNYNDNVATQDDFTKIDLPVVLDSYYHKIKSDGQKVLVILKAAQ
jgi:hypothetical protein